MMKSIEEIRAMSKNEFETECNSWSRTDCIKYLEFLGVTHPEKFYEISSANSIPIPIPYFRVGDVVRLRSDINGDNPMTVISLPITSKDAIFVMDNMILLKSVICTWIDKEGKPQTQRFAEDSVEKVNAPE